MSKQIHVLSSIVTVQLDQSLCRCYKQLTAQHFVCWECQVVKLAHAISSPTPGSDSGSHNIPSSKWQIAQNLDQPLLCSPSRPQAHLDSGKLQLKCSQLKSLIKFHENRIDWLSTGSRVYFGHLSGSNVALLVEASDHLFQECEEYKDGLKLLIDEQLVQKEAVHLMQFGSEVKPTECLHFSAKKNR